MILDEIVASRRNDLDKTIKVTPLEKIIDQSRRAPAVISLASAIKGKKVSLIAEVKKASPSRGVIKPDFNPVNIASLYAANGVAAISVLTEPEYFQGKLDYLKDIKMNLGMNPLPLLRKDFIIDAYQVYEARAYGADSLLLISTILESKQLEELLSLARQLYMDCLVEVHNESDLEKAVASGAGIIGINNRDLKTFTVDTAVTRRLRPKIPADRLVVSESGIKTAADIAMMREIGVNAVLIGEALMSARHPAAKIRELML